MLFALLAVTLFTACGDEDKPINKQTVSILINNRAIGGDTVAFSQGAARVVIDNTEMFMKITTDYIDAEGQGHTVTTSDMKMNSKSSSVYSFNNMASDTYSGFDNFMGYIDMSTGVIWYSFDEGTTHVVSTSQLLYIYTTTTLTNPEIGEKSHEQSAYLFALDDTGETCVMKISYFTPNTEGTVVSEIQYNDLTVTPTATGYTITADEVESNYQDLYTITDLNITLNDQCQIMSGSFKCDDYEFTISGQLLPIDNL